MKPPSIIFLTANGRFAKGVKICLSISKHHPESWQPSWSSKSLPDFFSFLVFCYRLWYWLIAKNLMAIGYLLWTLFLPSFSSIADYNLCMIVVRTALLAIIGFMPTPGHGAIGSLDYTPDEKKTLANRYGSSIRLSCRNTAYTIGCMVSKCFSLMSCEQNVGCYSLPFLSKNVAKWASEIFRVKIPTLATDRAIPLPLLSCWMRSLNLENSPT